MIIFESELIPFPMNIKTSNLNCTFLIKHSINKMSLSHPSKKKDQPSSIFFNDHTKSLERRRLHSKRLRNSAPNLGPSLKTNGASSPHEQPVTWIFPTKMTYTKNTADGPTQDSTHHQDWFHFKKKWRIPIKNLSESYHPGGVTLNSSVYLDLGVEFQCQLGASQ